MKSITVYFEDKDFAELEKKKGKKPWRDFILENAGVKNNEYATRW